MSSCDYDLLVVGAGLYGSIVAHEVADYGKRVLVIDRRDHIGGNCHTEDIGGINVHRYGAHIFRTNDEDVWRYVSKFCEFNNFINSPIANYKGELFNLPFNMNTFHALWGVHTPQEAHEMIDSQRIPCDHPENLEEHVLSLVGSDVYEKLVKGYTEKQWGCSCRELPASIMRRIPLRFTFDNNYFNAKWQGIPIGGYTAIFDRLLEKCDVRLSVDYLKERTELGGVANEIVYTGPIDEFYGYRIGELGYRSLRFEHEDLPCENYQGVAVMNFTDRETPFTRVIEHKHFEHAATSHTVISKEYPQDWRRDVEPYYPMEDRANRMKYARYSACADSEEGVFFGGRLGEYRYYDMQDTVKSALAFVSSHWGIR